RWVARALEPVQLGGGERVGGRNLVDDEHVTARAGHAGELRDGELRPRDVVQRADAGGEVEGSLLEGKPRRVPLEEAHVREPAGPAAGLFEQLGDEIDADDLPHERSDRKGEGAGAGARVEDPLVAARLDERTHLLAQLFAAAFLPLGHERGRSGEAVANRLSVRVVWRAQGPPLSWRRYRRPAPPRS